MLTASISPADWNLYRDRDRSCHHTAVKCTDHVERVSVGVDQSYPVSGLDLSLPSLVVEANLVEKVVGDLEAAAEQLAVAQGDA